MTLSASESAVSSMRNGIGGYNELVARMSLRWAKGIVGTANSKVVNGCT